MESILQFQPKKNATGLGSTEQNKNDFFRGSSFTCQTIKKTYFTYRKRYTCLNKTKLSFEEVCISKLY